MLYPWTKSCIDLSDSICKRFPCITYMKVILYNCYVYDFYTFCFDKCATRTMTLKKKLFFQDFGLHQVLYFAFFLFKKLPFYLISFWNLFPVFEIFFKFLKSCSFSKVFLKVWTLFKFWLFFVVSNVANNAVYSFNARLCILLFLFCVF